MRIRRNPSRILDLSSSAATAQVQPEAPLSEEPVLPPPAPAPPASHVDDVADALMLLSTPPSEELYDDDGLVGDAWREPRENPGLSYTNLEFVLQQDEEETESESEVEEEIFLVRRTKVEDKIGKEKQPEEEEEVNEKLKRDGNQQKKKGSKSKTMKAKVITAADEPPRCKKTDGRKWTCRSSAVLPHTLCEKHLSRSRSYYSSGKEAPGEGSSKSAPQKASAGSGAAPAKASSGSKRARASAPSSSTDAALASDDAPARSKAAPSAAAGARPSSKRPQKTTKEDVYYSGGAFYYPEPFGPFRGKQRGRHSSPAAIVVEEEARSTQGDGSTSEAPEEGLFPEAKLSSKATRKPLKMRTLESLHQPRPSSSMCVQDQAPGAP